MLIPNLWARFGLFAVAGLLFIFTLKTLDLSASYSHLRHAIWSEPAESKGAAGRPVQSGQSEHYTPTWMEHTVNHAATEDLGRPRPTSSGTAERTQTRTSTLHQSSDVATTSMYATTTAMRNASNTAAADFTVSRKAVVMGKMTSDNTSWVANELPGWEHAIYVVDLPPNATSPTGLRTKVNRAKEAMPYLTYIVQNYDTFPDIAVFIHSHRKGFPHAWHTDAKDFDIVNLLSELRFETVLERGYVNLRCLEKPGCPVAIRTDPDDPNLDFLAELAYPHLYAGFFNMTVDEVKQQVPVVGAHCCAQFAVSRAQVHKRPKAEYEWFISLIEESDFGGYLDGGRFDAFILGAVMEYTWHILFGKDAVNCDEDHKTCWKELYGRGEDYVNEPEATKYEINPTDGIDS